MQRHHPTRVVDVPGANGTAGNRRALPLYQEDDDVSDQATVTLSFTNEQFLRSSTWARWRLEIPLTVD